MIRHGIQFSDKPCRRCGWHHQVDAFMPGDMVLAPHPNRLGVVQEWRNYGSDVWVRVHFGGTGTDAVRANFSPCELERA